MNKFLPRLLYGLLVAIVLLLLAVVAARLWFDHYVRSEAFRHALEEGAANTLHAQKTGFAPLRFDGGLVYSEEFLAQDGRAFSRLEAAQMFATFDWHGLLHHAVQIDEFTIHQLSVFPPAAGVASSPQTAEELNPAPENAGGKRAWTIDLRKAIVNHADFSWTNNPAGGGITGTALTLTPEEGGAWHIDASGGELAQAGWPALKLETAELRWQKSSLYINSSSLADGPGRVTVTGSVEAHRALDLHLKLAGIDVAPLLQPDWKKRLSGQLSGDVAVQAPLGTDAAEPAVSGSGSLVLNEGRLTALPVLDEIGLFTRTERFRQIDLTRASADFTRDPGRTVVRNLVVESAGLIRVEGTFTVENGQIDGDFQVGLTPNTLQWIPGSQGQVFTASRDGYLWAPMKLSGPAARPVDDLTPRLAAAAANGVVNKVEDTVKKAGDVLNSLLH